MPGSQCGARPFLREHQMNRIIVLVLVALLQFAFQASAERITRKPPSDIEAARIASDEAMRDGNLRDGDIVSTDRGFFQFRGIAPDGGFKFLPVPNPLSSSKKETPGSPR